MREKKLRKRLFVDDNHGNDFHFLAFAFSSCKSQNLRYSDTALGFFHLQQAIRSDIILSSTLPDAKNNEKENNLLNQA